MNAEESLKRAEYVKANREKFLYYAARARDTLKRETIEAYGGKCQHCGITDPDVLTIDHIHNDGVAERTAKGKASMAGFKQYGILKKQGWPKDRYQLLCFNCNFKKEIMRRRNAMIERLGEERQVSVSHSHANIPPPSHNKSGIKGVFWNNQSRKWNARLMVNYKTQHLGSFDNIRDAANAYAAKAIETWGDMARVATEEEILAAIEKNNKPLFTTQTPEELGL